MGQNGYSLTCGVIGAENLNPLFIHTTYQWTKKNRTHEQIIPKRSKILSFSSLKTSDAGRYTCQATISSSFFLHKDITIMDSQDIIVQRKLKPLRFMSQYANDILASSPDENGLNVITPDCMHKG